MGLCGWVQGVQQLPNGLVLSDDVGFTCTDPVLLQWEKSDGMQELYNYAHLIWMLAQSNIGVFK